MIVAKFGGTSLADAKAFAKVRSIIRDDPRRRYIVPSAPGKRHKDDSKITDLLYSCHARCSQGLEFDQVFNLIAERYLELVAELDLQLDLHPYLATIRRELAKGASLDYVVSRGEYLNGVVLAAYLDFSFVEAADLIRFNQWGVFDPLATELAIQEGLQSIERAVIPGFYGAAPSGEIRVFSRGGSDITGALLAGALQAELYENWTDVSGFLMADPRIVDNPKQIERITYRELRELSYMGAEVLHQESMFPVRQKDIPICIKSTIDPGKPGTLIVGQAGADSQGKITGIAGRKDFTIISLERDLMNTELGFIRRLLSILEENSISFEHIPSGIDTVSLVVLDNELQGKLDKVLQQIEDQLHPDKLEVFTDVALIATVGQGMAYIPGIAARLFAALAEAKVNVRMIDQGSSEINIIVGVETDQFEQAVRAIYRAFVEEKQQAVLNGA